VELRHLRYFVAVAEQLSFTRAAERLHVAQPALSRQIRQLEEEVGISLFQRDHRSVSLTEAGRSFWAEAKLILQQSEHAVKSLQTRAKLEQRELNLGYVWGLFHTFAPAVLARFWRDYPQVAVNLFDRTAMQQAKALAEGRLDAGFIGFAEEADRTGLSKLKVGSCQFLVALPRQHALARQKKVSLEALREEFFIAISEESYPAAAHVISSACRRAGFRPKALQSAERGFTAISLVAANCGVALLPEALQALPHEGVIFCPLAQPVKADLFLAWHDQGQAELLRNFREAVSRFTRWGNVRQSLARL
jgi:DNA-binding transcriptional LysR family regulator